MDCNKETTDVDPEAIVISGIAGRFPKSHNIRHLQENLFNKMDLGSDDNRRWNHDHPDVPQRTGKVDNIEKFDAEYFDISFTEAEMMDPMCRLLLEHAYEAIVDAGMNPKDLYGTRTGVFIGTCYSESEKTYFYEKPQVAGLGLLGCAKSILANRISYWLGLTGPSFMLDSACSSSLIAVERAYRSIRMGECDAAIIGGSNLCLHPCISLQFSRLGVLSSTGFCRPFDEDAYGYMRSETVAVVYLQKAKNAKRIYATMVYAKTNCDGYKEQGITFPSSEMQGTLLQQSYDECGMPVTCLAYMEAHGTGTRVGDPEEINALKRVFCKNRKSPLLIGSIKSNLGHSEPASGLCQIAKVLIAMETSIIPPNIHFTKPRKGIEAFEDGSIRVVTDPTPWEPDYVGINSFGFGGANCHVLLQPNLKKKINGGTPNDNLPRLIVMSGRTEQAVESFLNEIENRPIDVDYVRLLHDLFAKDISGHPYRGYSIIESATMIKPIKKIQQYSGVRKPVCFVFSGIGSQWPGMGKHGVISNNILNSLVGITVMQVGLIDLLKSINVTPDHVIGYSIGELCCGYVTGNFTIEQVILSAYYIGLALNETKIIRGAMMNIALSYEKAKSICPPDIEISRFSPNSCFISGPKESVKALATKLQLNSIKEINCDDIPLHSRYLTPAEATIHTYLNRIIPQTMTSSHIWTSSVCDTKLSYAEFFTNNLLRPVFFEKVTQSIPKNAIMIEIAPDDILQNVMKDFSDTNVALIQRNHKDNVKVFLQGLGKIYNTGSQPQLANLYPAVQFPVSRGTPMISPSIKWDHSEDWYIASFKVQKPIFSNERLIEMMLGDEDFEYMSGHVIDGRILLPATGYLVFVWETIGMLRRQLQTEVSVVFEDVKFLRATHFPKQGIIELTIMIQKVTGKFEIIEGGNAVVTGTIRVPADITKEKVPYSFLREDNNEEEVMKVKDIYKELKLRGYQYSGVFRGLKSASSMGQQGHIAWGQNWVTFMDCMLQIQILGMDTKSLYVPTGIQKLVIDPKLHAQHIRNLKTEENKQLPVYVYKNYDTVISGGIEIRGIKANPITRRKTTVNPVLERHVFVAHRDKHEISFRDAMILSIHIALEYHQMTKVNIIELIENSDQATTEELSSPIIAEILSNLPLIQPNINLIARTDRFNNIVLPPRIALSQTKKLSKDDNAILVAGFNLLNNSKVETLKEALLALKNDGFLLTRGEPVTKDDLPNVEKHGLVVILEKRIKKEHITLLKRKRQSTRKTEVIRVNNYDFSWLEELKAILNAESESSNTARIILVGEKDPECGILGLVNCLRREPGGELIRGMFIQDENAPDFSLHEPLYAQQLELDLIINVLRPGKVWGSYRHLPLDLPTLKPVHHAFVNQLIRGDLSSFRWLQGAFTPDYHHQDLVHIIYTSINFKDVMTATGKVNMDSFASRGRLEECFIGLEYVGIDNAGRRIMGICENQCISNMQQIDRKLCWSIPEQWTLEDAATIPCAYSTCYYALYIRAKMKKGDKILIHSGTGAVGQAAINLSLHKGCEVFTTVGTPEKRKFIRDTFPSIPESHIGNSRDTSFEQMVLQQTKGRGVDIVLNSLAEEKLQASIRCLARDGCFLEIGKYDFLSDNLLDLSILSKGIKFFGIMLDNVFLASEKIRDYVYTVVAEGLKVGAVKPLARKVFQKDEVEAAFRYMAAGKHMGKIIIKVQEEDDFVNAPILAFPRYYCPANKTYVILGGLGGFGLELADWLVIRGARNLVLISRSGIKNGYQHRKIELWKSYGVNVSTMSNIDASNTNECEHILKTAEMLAPVDAIFNLAVVLNDKLCQNHTAETFQESFKAKAWATKNLDQLSRKICPQLRYFVVFSSVSCGRGNTGQTNYGMANSIMERICERRSREGLHGLAIQWGAVGDVGLVADMMDNDKEMIIGGTLQQKITSCIEKLEEFLLQEHPIVASMVVAEKRSHLFGAFNLVDTVANIMGKLIKMKR
ncbi:hypothetical protein DMN91_003281 [Ooceraea biroi]|uniref:Uncharacterized protein n=1 Tax=Ooceraea biroi TaxID=2015173 RepID=A0A3L8DZ17_OOCBI|nr:hypothetical protein DMN91_003281 [Ooceraea biroi]